MNRYFHVLIFFFYIYENTNLCHPFTIDQLNILHTQVYDYGKVHSIQHYVIKFFSDLRQVSGFLHKKKTDCHDIIEIFLKVVLSTITLTSSFKILCGKPTGNLVDLLKTRGDKSKILV